MIHMHVVDRTLLTARRLPTAPYEQAAKNLGSGNRAGTSSKTWKGRRMDRYTLIIAYYEGKTGDTKALLVSIECELMEVTPTDVELTEDDSFNSIQITHNDCNAIAFIEGPDNSVLICDVTQSGLDGAEAAGWDIVKRRDF
jgi:hypothetical protein